MASIRSSYAFLFKVLKWGILAALLVIFGFVGHLVVRARTALPDYNEIVVTPMVAGSVRVIRDRWGVPHITADSETDAYFALGYCMAQDRLFQMDLLRRIARGELAEVLGPPLVKVDRIMRGFRLRVKAEEIAASASSHFPDALKAAIDAFLAGINFHIATEPLPWEFSALMTDCRPFTLADCLAVAAILPLTFADGLRTDPLKTMLMGQFPEHDVDLLFRGIEAIPVTIMESMEETAAFQRDRIARTHDAHTKIGTALASRWLDALAASRVFVGNHLGSNSWVLSGEKTASGKPILANDPHIGFTNPNILYEAHMKYGDFENYGYHLPLIPLSVLGHNLRRGWGMTMFSNDDIDLYAEKVHPEDPYQVMYRGEWVRSKVVRERINVRLGRDVFTEIRITPHGPIINDLLGFLHGYEGPAVSLSWVWQHFDFTDFEAFYRMGHANDLESFSEAVRLITSPGLNISYADAQGNIAWWAAGLLPIRPPHVNPRTILEGWSGRDGIERFLPVEAAPHLINPVEGVIVTANNLPTIHPVGTPPYQIPLLQGYFKPGDRAGRIKELLKGRNDWTIEALRAVQMDNLGYAVRTMLPKMISFVRSQEEGLTPRHREALARLEAWDQRFDTDSIGATVFSFWHHSLLLEILGDELPEKLLKLYITIDDSWIAIQDLLDDPESHWWDDVRTPERETAAAITARALRHACAEIASRLGRNVSRWRWGRVHTVTFRHPIGYLPLVGRLLNIGPLEPGGASQVVNHMLSRAFHDFDVLAGPATRRLIDFAAPDQSLTILYTGNSGHVLSPHYDDQAQMFARGEYRQALMNEEDIFEGKVHEMWIVHPDKQWQAPVASSNKSERSRRARIGEALPMPDRSAAVVGG